MPSVRSLVVSSLCGLLLAGCGNPEVLKEADAAGSIGTQQDSLYPIIILNYLLNPGFETPDPVVPLYDGEIAHATWQSAYFAGRASAAENWPATSNFAYGTVSSWLTNERYSSSGRSLLVAAGTQNGGVSQIYWQSGTPPLKQKLTVRVKVVAGRVVAGIGRSGYGWATTYSQANPNLIQADGTAVGPQWETLSVCAPAGVGANQVYLYASGGPAVYYLDAASVFDNSNCP
ncbi:MAG TPA: hypothetical protein VK420_22600 [Longimicrobium sp.]|nr:hypothetical protein [Longimicrobium sp.]